MKTTSKSIFTPCQDINAGNFVVNIGILDTTDVCIFSKSSGDFVKLKQTKVSKKLKRVKRNFKAFLCSDQDFVFRFMQDDDTINLIKILKG
tara:strand:+ start:16440 stop:16712 length:273 start_codon:yes stop_codon:yes gene_type:complete